MRRFVHGRAGPVRFENVCTDPVGVELVGRRLKAVSVAVDDGQTDSLLDEQAGRGPSYAESPSDDQTPLAPESRELTDRIHLTPEPESPQPARVPPDQRTASGGRRSRRLAHL